MNISDETLTDYSFLSRDYYTKSKNYLKKRYRIRHWIPMLIRTPCTVNLWYFKLRLLDQTEFMVWNIQGLRHRVTKIYGLSNQSMPQNLNSFKICSRWWRQNVWTGLIRSMQFTFNCSKNFLVGTFLFMFHPPLSKYFFVFEINCVFKNLDGKNSWISIFSRIPRKIKFS